MRRSASRYTLFLLISMMSLLVPSWGEQSPASETGNEAPYIKADRLNSGLPGFASLASKELTTPERALSYFVRQCREGNYQSAAYALNLQDIDITRQPSAGSELARKLYLVMERHTGFPFEDLPDRSDGEQPPSMGANSVIGGEPRKAFLLSTLPLEIGQFEIYLMRYRTPGSQDMWLFAPTTVGRIGEAFEQRGPRKWESQVPEWTLRRTPDGTPVWAWGLLIASIATTVALGRVVKMTMARFVRSKLLDRLWGGVVLLLATWIPYFSLHWWVPLPNPLLYFLLFVGFCSLIWLVSTALNEYSTQIIRGEIESVKDLDAIAHLGDKRKLTYLSVGRRLLSFLALAIGVGAVAMKTPHFETVGMSLMASAGVVSVILGIAAQPILGNIISGVQIAISRPIRVGDAILYGDDWCYVEEITFMYVLCRTWDERRLIIPLTYFVSQPFSSYSLKNPQTLRTIDMPLDYEVNVDGLRQEYERLAKESALWSEHFQPKLEVLEFTERGVQIRAIATADNAANAWDLHCEIREGLLKYLQTQQHQALPRVRLKSSDGKVSESVDARLEPTTETSGMPH